MKHEECEYCDSVVEQAVRRVPFRNKKETIYVDNVRVQVCRRCGEIYYEAEVYKELEKIAANGKQVNDARFGLIWLTQLVSRL